MTGAPVFCPKCELLTAVVRVLKTFTYVRCLNVGCGHCYEIEAASQDPAPRRPPHRKGRK